MFARLRAGEQLSRAGLRLRARLAPVGFNAEWSIISARTWVPYIHAKDCSLLPTATKSDGGVLDSAMNDSMEFVPTSYSWENAPLWAMAGRGAAGLTRLWILATESALAAERRGMVPDGFPTGWTELLACGNAVIPQIREYLAAASASRRTGGSMSFRQQVENCLTRDPYLPGITEADVSGRCRCRASDAGRVG